MSITQKGYTANLEGLSTDTPKPTDVELNTIFHELDTDKYYYFDGTDWNEMPSSGGGSSFEPTQAQLDAMNSGATTEKINQIATNTTNISSLTPVEQLLSCTITTADTYEKVATVDLPPQTTLQISAAGYRKSSNAVTGIYLLWSNVNQTDNIISISESSTMYLTLGVNAVVKNVSANNTYPINVYMRAAAAETYSLSLVYRFISEQ